MESVYEGLEEVQFVGYLESEIDALEEVFGELVEEGNLERAD